MFTHPKDIRHPKGGLIHEPIRQPKDFIFGGPNSRIMGSAPLNETGIWVDSLPVVELQKNGTFDTYGCVSFSLNNVHETLHKKQYGEEINKCDRYTIVGSGTKPGRGNSKSVVAEWNRKNGFVFEPEWPLLPLMTETEYYNGGKVPANLLTEGQGKLTFYEFTYEWLNDNRPITLLSGLKYSPIQVDVGPYVTNEKGYIINTPDGQYYHEVMICGYEMNKCWWVFDSETTQMLRFDWGYQFGSPMIHSLTRKNMPTLYKTKDSPAVYALDDEKKNLIAFADGQIIGEELFKTLYGISNFSQIPIKVVDVLPYPVAPYEFTTK